MQLDQVATAERDAGVVADDTARAWRVAALVFVALTALFLLTAPANRTESDDAHQFALEIEQGIASHGTPRHVAFVPVMHGAFVVVRAVGISDDALLAASVINALIAAVAVALQFLVLRLRLGLSTRTSLIGSGLLAATYGFWRFSAEVEVYPLALATALLAVLVGLSPRATTPWRIAGVATVAAVAVSAYSANVLLALLVIPVYLLASGRARSLAVYGAVLVPALMLTVAVPYLAARQPGESFTDAYGAAEGGSLGVESAVKVSVGAGQSIISSGFLFSYPRFADEIASRIPDRALDDEVYLAATVGPARRTVMTTTFALSLLAVLAAACLAVPALVRTWRRPEVAALLAWVGGVVGFQISRPEWADGPELWLLALPPFTMLVTIGLAGRRDRSGRWGSAMLAALLIVLLLHNGLGMALIQGTDGDRNAARAAWLLDNAGPTDTILTADSSLFHRYLEYHVDAEVVFVVDPVTEGEDLDEVLASAVERGGTVYATGDVFAPPAYLEHQDPARFRVLVGFGESIEPRFVLVDGDEFGGVYRLMSSGV